MSSSPHLGSLRFKDRLSAPEHAKTFKIKPYKRKLAPPSPPPAPVPIPTPSNPLKQPSRPAEVLAHPAAPAPPPAPAGPPFTTAHRAHSSWTSDADSVSLMSTDGGKVKIKRYFLQANSPVLEEAFAGRSPPASLAVKATLKELTLFACFFYRREDWPAVPAAADFIFLLRLAKAYEMHALENHLLDLLQSTFSLTDPATVWTIAAIHRQRIRCIAAIMGFDRHLRGSPAFIPPTLGPLVPWSSMSSLLALSHRAQQPGMSYGAVADEFRL